MPTHFETNNGFIINLNEPHVATIYGAGGPRIVRQGFEGHLHQRRGLGAPSTETVSIRFGATFDASEFQSEAALRRRTVMLSIPVLRRAAALFSSGSVIPEIERRQGNLSMWSTTRFHAEEGQAPYFRDVGASAELRCDVSEADEELASRAAVRINRQMRDLADGLHGVLGRGEHPQILG